MKQGQYKITKEQQLKELIERIPPIVNVAVVIAKLDKYLMGHRNPKRESRGQDTGWLFPGGRMLYTETPQETASRIMRIETPGLKAHVRKFITVMSDKGFDYRANGVTIYYLCDYVSGKPKPNAQLDRFVWVDRESVVGLTNVYEVELKMFQEIDLALRTMHSNEDEFLVEVDRRDREIGSILKREAHSTSKRFHRAAHVMIFNSRGEVVLQQRSMSVLRYPGFWDMPGGHQVFGQTIVQCAEAELAEELGVRTELTYRRTGLYQPNSPTDTQSEFYYLFCGVSDGPYGYDRNEVLQVRSFNCRRILHGDYDQEFKIMPHVRVYIEELRDVWEPLLSAA